MAPPVAKPKRVQRTPSEQHVVNLFVGNGHYQGFGCCANPACADPTACVLTAGSGPSARICLVCFEFEFGCSFPTRLRLEGMRA